MLWIEICPKTSETGDSETEKVAGTETGEEGTDVDVRRSFTSPKMEKRGGTEGDKSLSIPLEEAEGPGTTSTWKLGTEDMESDTFLWVSCAIPAEITIANARQSG